MRNGLANAVDTAPVNTNGVQCIMKGIHMFDLFMHSLLPEGESLSSFLYEPIIVLNLYNVSRRVVSGSLQAALLHKHPRALFMKANSQLLLGCGGVSDRIDQATKSQVGWLHKLGI